MALDDILQAIKTHADRELASAKKAHDERMSTMRESSAADTDRKIRDIAEQKDAKLRALRQKADAFASSQIKHATLTAKKRALDDVYAETASALAAMPAAKLESLLRACLDGLPSGGTIRPAAAHAAVVKTLVGTTHAIGDSIDAVGGFVYIANDREIDCTFESLVERILRPETELDTSATLFA